MKQLLFISILFLSVNSIQAQDKVVLRTGDTLTVNVTKNTETAIEFTYPNETAVNEKQKRDISFIIYASGRREEIKQQGIAIPEISGEDDWEKVVVTSNRDDVAGLSKVKSLSVSAGNGGVFDSASKAHEKAIKKLKKKVAKMKYGVVLITSENFGGQYNNISSVTGEIYK
ncbi:MAG: hypothetical protein IJ698_10605 [Prevotella sp.]|nr:hypothetical protein [Prevotella sp.]